LSASADGPPVWSRGEAIDRLRGALLALTDEEHSLCEVAAEKGIFCRGFRRFDDAEFRRRFRSTLGNGAGHLDRARMERLANVFELSMQRRWRVSLACDAQTRARGGHCRGWDEFSNDELGRFCADILGCSVVIL
jgi:uncharacterized protein YbjT (DUF2867 family)